MQVHVHQRQAHHVGRDVVALEVACEFSLFVGRERTVSLVVRIGAADMLVGRNQEPGGAAGRVENGFVFFRVDDGDHEVDDMTRRAELSGVALRTENREQILEGVSQSLAVIVLELVNDFEKGAQGFRVAVGQVGVLEDVSEERRDARVFRHPGNCFGIQVQGFVAPQSGAHQSGPAVAGKVAGEELAFAPQLFACRVDVVHELVDQGDGDLLHLAFRIGHLTHENVAGGVNAAFGGSVEHDSLMQRTGLMRRNP